LKILRAQWIQTSGPCGGSVRPLVVSGSNLLAGTNGGVFVTTDNGTSWNAVNTGLMNRDVQSLVVNGPNLFAGTGGAGAWRRSRSEMVTRVDRTPGRTPAGFSLEPNFPNPFNQETVIQYHLPQSADVSVQIYGLSGQSLRTLVHDRQTAGRHSMIWDGIDDHGRTVSSGTYIYRIRTKEFIQAKIMTLAR
jgi:hypothetical protein